jgi:hypothetical protein
VCRCAYLYVLCHCVVCVAVFLCVYLYVLCCCVLCITVVVFLSVLLYLCVTVALCHRKSPICKLYAYLIGEWMQAFQSTRVSGYIPIELANCTTLKGM